MIGIRLISALEHRKNENLISRDLNGNYHFNGNFHNIKDVKKVLEELRTDEQLNPLVEEDASKIEDLFIRTFNHQEFTGRSGSFFGYEGLGSIYWHMVSKLLLAAQEAASIAHKEEQNTELVKELAAAYYDIRNGIGFNKSPQSYGAFPTDPYSHSPAGKGAKQPGMTGQVKEEIITRLVELGLTVEQGQIKFRPFLIRKEEDFWTKPLSLNISMFQAAKNLLCFHLTLLYLLSVRCRLSLKYHRKIKFWLNGKMDQLKYLQENQSLKK